MVLRTLGIAVTVVAFIGLTFSGAMASWREMLNYAKLYDNSDFDLAAWITEKTPPTAIFLNDITQSNHIRVESSLAGRQVAHGFAGWLHSHGIDANARRMKLMQVLEGSEAGVAALGELNISFVTVDAPSKNNFNYAFLDDVANHVATNGKYSVWEVLPEVREGWQQRACEGLGISAPRRECLEAGCWFREGRYGSSPLERRCTQKPRRRLVEDCLPGASATAETCRSAGCIWIKDFPGPWCQKPASPKPERIPAISVPIPGSDCGWSSMSAQDCVDNGCVWKVPPSNWDPFCTQPFPGQKPGEY